MICSYCGDDHSWLYCRKKPEGWKPPKKPIIGRPKDGQTKKSTAAPPPVDIPTKRGRGRPRTITDMRAYKAQKERERRAAKAAKEPK